MIKILEKMYGLLVGNQEVKQLKPDETREGKLAQLNKRREEIEFGIRVNSGHRTPEDNELLTRIDDEVKGLEKNPEASEPSEMVENSASQKIEGEDEVNARIKELTDRLKNK